jgi:hypothetical protein
LLKIDGPEVLTKQIRLLTVLEMAGDCVAEHGLQFIQRIRLRENSESQGAGFVAALQAIPEQKR